MWQVILEGRDTLELRGLKLLFEDELERGRKLLVLEGPSKAFEEFLLSLPAGLLVSWEETSGHLLRLPSGLALKGFGSPGPEELVLRSRGAFGSGFHPTTRLCLRLLDDFLQENPPGWGLDFGAGTGILSLVAAKRGCHMVALEIDQKALEVLKENAQRNHLSSLVHPVCGGLEAVRGPFSLVLANIYLRFLVPEAPKLKALVPGGALILSGFFEESLSQVLAAYGEEPARVVIEKGWAAVLFRLTP